MAIRFLFLHLPVLAGACLFGTFGNIVHAADVDRNGSKELLILCEQMTGAGPTGAQPFYETYVYAWNGVHFVLREEVRQCLANLSTAAQIRTKLGVQ